MAARRYFELSGLGEVEITVRDHNDDRHIFYLTPLGGWKWITLV